MKNQHLKSTLTIAIAAMLMFAFNSDVKAQSKKKSKFKGERAAFHKGSNSLYLGLGVGIGYGYYGDISTLPAFFMAYDHGIIDNAGPGNIGLGGIIAVKAATYKYSAGGYKAVWRNYLIGVRGTWHLTALADKNNRFDPYAGVTVGARISTYEDTYYKVNPAYTNPYDDQRVSPIGGAFIGAKYNFARSVGVFAEAGYDISLFRAGLSFNF
jgi:hypothetical protein